jgi:hypothetical protein
MHRYLRRLTQAALTVAVLATPGQADQIRFGHGGSIFGGATWTITPDDHVRFDAYQYDGSLSARGGWVWDSRDNKQGHITFAMPGAFATVAEIARAGLEGLGQAPAYVSGCLDAGALILEVEAAGVGFAAHVDGCAGQDNAPADVRGHYEAVLGVQREMTTTLGLDRLH